MGCYWERAYSKSNNIAKPVFLEKNVCQQKFGKYEKETLILETVFPKHINSRSTLRFFKPWIRFCKLRVKYHSVLNLWSVSILCQQQKCAVMAPHSSTLPQKIFYVHTNIYIFIYVSPKIEMWRFTIIICVGHKIPILWGFFGNWFLSFKFNLNNLSLLTCKYFLCFIFTLFSIAA